MGGIELDGLTKVYSDGTRAVHELNLGTWRMASSLFSWAPPAAAKPPPCG